ncbi:hypothetical protein PI124_g15219 [Phytophthora idaei]|nr:hypothetical protein PI126_g17672 [Phytophthora idaei]KAG3239853.1 hypothetical protein PI124_g15219 [Phytophthora idaei]
MSTTKNNKKETSEDKKKAHPPFDGQDFEVWLERITLKLQRKRLWKYYEREPTEPSLTDDESKGEECEAPIMYTKESRRGKEILYDGMTDKVMKTVKYESTLFRVMEHLEKTIHWIGLLGKPLDDYEKPVLLIGSLPSDYDNVVESHSDIVAEQTSGAPTAGSCFSGTACTAFCVGPRACTWGTPP